MNINCLKSHSLSNILILKYIKKYNISEIYFFNKINKNLFHLIVF